MQRWQKRTRFPRLVNPGIYKTLLTPKLLKRWDAKPSDLLPRAVKESKHIERDGSSDETTETPKATFQEFLRQIGHQFQELQKNPQFKVQISELINSPINNAGTPPPPPPPPLVPATPVKNCYYVPEPVEQSELRPFNLAEDFKNDPDFENDPDVNNFLQYEDCPASEIGDTGFTLDDFLHHA